MCDEAFGDVYGSTDSEHFFALLIDSLLGLDEPDPAPCDTTVARKRLAAR